MALSMVRELMQGSRVGRSVFSAACSVLPPPVDFLSIDGGRAGIDTSGHSACNDGVLLPAPHARYPLYVTIMTRGSP